MTESWKKICSEIIEAGERAPPRPYKMIGQPEPGVTEEYEYWNLAANHADRLARFATRLADIIRTQIDSGDYVERLEHLDRLWKESR